MESKFFIDLAEKAERIDNQNADLWTRIFDMRKEIESKDKELEIIRQHNKELSRICWVLVSALFAISIATALVWRFGK